MQEGTKPIVDILEHGMDRDGTRRSSDRRLFMQLQVFTGASDDGCNEGLCANRKWTFDKAEDDTVLRFTWSDQFQCNVTGIDLTPEAIDEMVARRLVAEEWCRKYLPE